MPVSPGSPFVPFSPCKPSKPIDPGTPKLSGIYKLKIHLLKLHYNIQIKLNNSLSPRKLTESLIFGSYFIKKIVFVL